MNRKDAEGKNLFAGGFLGLDHIGVFDRGQLSPGQALEQADGTAWMAFYCGTLLSMALELSPVRHRHRGHGHQIFSSITCPSSTPSIRWGARAFGTIRTAFTMTSSWRTATCIPLRIRSAVGLIPLFAAEILDEEKAGQTPEFYNRMKWFMAHRPEEAGAILCRDQGVKGQGRFLLAVPTREKLERVLRYVLDENEFLSPYGIRMLSKYHQDHPYVLQLNGQEHQVGYEPGESRTGLFGGNSNWRGPVWMPINYLLIESLERYHHFYGDELKVECPTGSGHFMNLKEVALFLSERVEKIVLADEKGDRPCHGGEARYAKDPDWKDLILFYEYFHGDNGKGLGASHQTGWTALVAKLLEGHDHDHEI